MKWEKQLGWLNLGGWTEKKEYIPQLLNWGESIFHKWFGKNPFAQTAGLAVVLTIFIYPFLIKPGNVLTLILSILISIILSLIVVVFVNGIIKRTHRYESFLKEIFYYCREHNVDFKLPETTYDEMENIKKIISQLEGFHRDHLNMNDEVPDEFFKLKLNLLAYVYYVEFRHTRPSGSASFPHFRSQLENCDKKFWDWHYFKEHDYPGSISAIIKGDSPHFRPHTFEFL